MGISPQEHRIRIGIFNNKSKYSFRVGKLSLNKRRSAVSTNWMDIKLVIIFSLLLVWDGNIHEQNCKVSGQFIKHRSIAVGTKSVEIVNHNFESRYKFGNKKKNGVKIMHWNPGSKHLHNKKGN